MIGRPVTASQTRAVLSSDVISYGFTGTIASRCGGLSTAASHLAATAQTYLTIASGKLDDENRIHPFQNLVSLFASALGAAIVDPAAAIVTTDPGEWADAMEMSLQIEKEMGTLRK